MKVGELFVSLGVDADQGALDKFTNGVEDLSAAFTALKVAAAAAAIKTFTQQAIDSTVAIQNFMNQTGLLTTQVRQFVASAQLADVAMSAEEITGSLQGLQQAIADIRLGQGNIEPFLLLGINPNNANIFQVLDQLRARVKGLRPEVAVNLLQQLGLNPNFINILKMTRKEFEKLAGGKTFLDPEQEKAILSLGNAYTSLGISIDNLIEQFTAAFAPAIELVIEPLIWLIDILTQLGKFISKNVTPIFERFVNSVGYLLTKLGDAIERVWSYVSRLASGFDSLGIAAEDLKAVLIPLALVFTPILGAIAALLLFLDDLAVYMQGGKSVIGAGIENLGKLFDRLRKKISSVASNIWDGFLSGLEGVGDAIYSAIVAPIMTAYNAIREMIGLDPVLSGEEGLGSEQNRAIIENLLKAPASGIGAAAGLGQATNIFQNNFTINGANDPEGLAYKIQGVMQTQLNNTQQSFNNGALN